MSTASTAFRAGREPEPLSAVAERETGDRSLLLTEFQTLVVSAGGVGRVRKLILELAIQGRLSRPEAGDDLATALHESARRDRLQRIGAGRARHMDDLPEVDGDDAPWPPPVGWVWTRIGLAMNLVNGRAFKPTDWSTSGTPIVRIQNLNNPSAPFNFCNFDVEPKHRLRAGDFLISWSGTPGTSFGAFIWSGPDGVLNQHIFRAEVYGKGYDLRFLRVAINARLDEMIAQAHGGVGLQHITKGKLEALPIPLPPLAEQKRIVAKVDQLMALCDELEAKQAKKRDVGDRLTKAALAALTSAETPEDFKIAWQRVAGCVEVLTNSPARIGDLRDTISTLALQGRCSTHSGRASVFSEGPFALPAGWQWKELGQVGKTSTGTTPPTGDPSLFGADLPFVCPGDITPDGVQPASRGLSSAGAEVARVVPPGSLLMVCIGGSIGKVAVTRQRVAFNQQINAIAPHGGVLAEFLLVALRAPYFRDLVLSRAGQGTLPILSKSKWEKLPVPIPPEDEQQELIDGVCALFGLCDDLEAKIASRNRQAELLAEALVMSSSRLSQTASP